MTFRLADVVTPDSDLRYVVVDDHGSIVEPMAGYLRYLRRVPDDPESRDR